MYNYSLIVVFFFFFCMFCIFFWGWVCFRPITTRDKLTFLEVLVLQYRWRIRYDQNKSMMVYNTKLCLWIPTVNTHYILVHIRSNNKITSRTIIRIVYVLELPVHIVHKRQIHSSVFYCTVHRTLVHFTDTCAVFPETLN